MADFQLRNVPLLSRVGADRSDNLRTDIDAAVAGWADAAVLRVDSRGQVMIADGHVVLGDTARSRRQPARQCGVPRTHRGRSARVGDPRPAGATRRRCAPTLRSSTCAAAGTDFDDVSAQLVASATALLNWHDNARFSAIDGAPTKPVKARLVAGQPGRPATRSSRASTRRSSAWCTTAPTGWCWPGRRCGRSGCSRCSPDSSKPANRSRRAWCVRSPRRSGCSVRDVRYLGSQPWPFPRSLMVGFHAVADPDQEFSFNDGEIAEAHWFTRDEVRAALAARGLEQRGRVAVGTASARARFRSPGRSSSRGPALRTD